MSGAPSKAEVIQVGRRANARAVMVARGGEVPGLPRSEVREEPARGLGEGDGGAPVALAAESLPPPPRPPAPPPLGEDNDEGEEEEQGIAVDKGGASCPLCRQPRENPTLLTTSGYAFCYKCIHGFISQKGKCPVTLLPCDLDCLCRLFGNPSSSN